MKKSCCIIIPIYNKNPNPSELVSIGRAMDIFSQSYDMVYVCGNSLDVSVYPELKVIRFDNSFFKSNKSYSKLLLSEEFYDPFIEYEYMLIAQTDSYVLNTKYSLDDFINKGYDYWGAPWSDGPITKPYTIKDIIKLIMLRKIRKVRVGNGGFSLRRVSTMLSLIEKNRTYLKLMWWFNEDLFFSRECMKMGTVAPVEEARSFAGEQDIEESINNGNIPYGVHAYEKYYPQLKRLI